MAEESFILVNLKEAKSKKLAQVISNETSRKILEYLAKKEATETEIAADLGVPISTVHYSLVHLKEVNLVQVDEFHYSKKGKVVDHYKLSNKMVIIAPHAPSIESIKEKLSKLFPAFLISFFGAGTIYLINFFRNKFSENVVPESAMMLRSVAEPMADEAVAGAMMAKAAPEAMMYAADSAPTVSQMLSLDPALWFLIGSIFALGIYFTYDIVKSKIQSKNKTNKR